MISSCLPFPCDRRPGDQPGQNGYPPLTTIYYYVSAECNLRCRHCWIAPQFSNQIKTFLRWDDLRPIFKEAIELGLTDVKLTGGEPLLHPEFASILQGLNSLGLNTLIETNGILLDEPLAELIKKTNTYVSISLDGSQVSTHENLRGVNGSFDRTVAAAKILQKHDVTFQVIFSLHRGNAEELLQTALLAKQLGAASLKVNPIAVEQRAGKMNRAGELFGAADVIEIFHRFQSVSIPDFRIIFDLPPAFYPLQAAVLGDAGICGIHNLLGLLANGTASVCGIGEKVEELNFGSVLTRGVRSVWTETPVLNELRARIPGSLGGICSACIHAAYCLGKCAAMNYYDSGSLFAGHSFCQEAYEQGLFPENRLYRQPRHVEREGVTC